MKTPLFEYSFAYFGKTDIGLNRLHNEDEVVLCPAEGFFAVSDGMGGLLNGGLTSEIIAGFVPDLMASLMLEAIAKDDIYGKAALLEEMVRELSDGIFAMGNQNGSTEYGATFTGVWLLESKAVFVNVGDSRGYVLSKAGILRQVTIDHNEAQHMVAMGHLSKAEAGQHYTSAILTRYMGMAAPVKVDIFVEDVNPCDKILLCSDGLSGMLNDDEIGNLLAEPLCQEDICNNLIKAANKNGGMDNIAVVVVDVNI